MTVRKGPGHSDQNYDLPVVGLIALTHDEATETAYPAPEHQRPSELVIRSFRACALKHPHPPSLPPPSAKVFRDSACRPRQTCPCNK